MNNKFYGWKNKETGKFRRTFITSNGKKTCVFKSLTQAEKQINKFNRTGKYTNYEVAIICDNVERDGK